MPAETEQVEGFVNDVPFRVHLRYAATRACARDGCLMFTAGVLGDTNTCCMACMLLPSLLAKTWLQRIGQSQTRCTLPNVSADLPAWVSYQRCNLALYGSIGIDVAWRDFLRLWTKSDKLCCGVVTDRLVVNRDR